MVKDKLVLLLVDDSEWIVDNMIGILQELVNVRIVFQAGSYLEAVGIIEEIEPDMVLMDIYLEEKISFDLIKFIAAYYPSIETVILTNYVDQQYRTACMKIRPHHFFDKSGDLGPVIKLISGKNGTTEK